MKSKLFTTLLLVNFKASFSLAQATVAPTLRAALQINPTAQVVVTFKGAGAPQLTQLSLL